MSQEKDILNQLSLLNMPSAEGQKDRRPFCYLALGQGALILGNPSETEETRHHSNIVSTIWEIGGVVLLSSSGVTDGIENDFSRRKTF